MRVGSGLDSCRTSADDHEGEEVVGSFVPQVLGILETVDHVVAYPQGVLQTFDVHGVLFGAWSAEVGRVAARGQDEVVVRIIAPARLYPASLEVHSCYLVLKILYAQGP